MIDAHRGAFEYDWRARFHLPLRAVGRSMPWGEAYRLAKELARDPSSRVGAALAGWDYSTTYGEMILRDMYDLQHQLAWAQGGGKGSRPKPYPRPWPDRNARRTKPSVTPQEVLAALRTAGHTAQLPGDAEVAHG